MFLSEKELFIRRINKIKEFLIMLFSTAIGIIAFAFMFLVFG